MASEARRAFVLKAAMAAGVAPPAIALLAGAPAAFGDEPADLAILHAALTLEHHAIALYDHCLQRRLVPAGLRAYAVEFRGDHLGHRDTQVALSQERGGRPPVARKHYEFGTVGAGDDAVRHLHEVERSAQDAYLALISSIRTDEYMISAGFILVDEARHQTVWGRALGLRIY